jgi:hypothetical protein
VSPIKVKNPRSCVFCGARANSREHIFPDWINGVIVVDGADAHQFVINHGERADERHYKVKTVASQTARVVCKTCNTGWMSELEVESKPVVGPLIVNEATRLDAKQQLVAARWAIKIAMVGESIQYGDASFDQDDRDAIRENRLPLRARVSLAAYDLGEPSATRYTRGLGGINRNGEFFAEFYAHTIQIGHLVLSVRGTATFDATANRSLDEIARPRFMETPVWPPVETCDWPPPHVMNEKELLEYTGGNNLAPATPDDGPLSFNPLKLITDYSAH